MNKKTFLFMFLAVGVAVIFSTGAASAANTNNNTTAVNITTNHVTISGFNNIGTIFKVTSNINSNAAKDGGGIYNSGSLKLTDCYNIGTVTSVTSMVGAPFTPIVYQNKAPGNWAGVTQGPLQTVSYISGNTANNGSGGICGGICGYNSGSLKLTNCYNIGTITSATSNINSNNAKDSNGGIFSRGIVNLEWSNIRSNTIISLV